ncbi:acyltransferase family protein [Rhodoferax sp. WC2427]|uniref:acyltransferase family protein n=1 Tax=Rhodoferax sp. WC2427 TaxID=3234144 RepID=UPI0034676713
MGILRLYLALCVVGVHSGPIFPWSVHDGHQAVQIFYLISGFYMQMVYGTHYATPAEFYASRFMRIFIPYWIILALTLVLSLFSLMLHWQWVWTSVHPFFNAPLQHNGVLGVVLAGIANVTLFFQDWVMFLADDAGQGLVWTSDYRTSSYPLFHYLLIPQAWTISVELTFYLLVPFLSALRSRTLMAIAIASLCARIYVYEILGLKQDPWEYRFFPFEVFLFVLGMLSQRLYRQLPPSVKAFKLKSLGNYALASLVFIGVLVGASKGVEVLGAVIGYHYAVLIFYGLWALAIPVVFALFGNYKHDRFIGELSYPVYLGHLIAVSFAMAVQSKLGLPGAVVGPVAGLLSVVLALLLYVYLFKPLDASRYSLAKKFSARTVPQVR